MKSPDQGPSQEKPLSLAVLFEREQVSPDELKATLRDYAESGAGISDRVIALIDRVELTKDDLSELAGSARKGVEVQTTIMENKARRRGERDDQDVRKYQDVLDHLEKKMR